MNRIGTGKLRDLNDQIILKLLLRHQEVTKKELANYSRLTVATVGTILNDFLDNGTVVEKEIIYLKKGRPTKKYGLNPEYFHSLCLFVQRKRGRDYLCWQIIDALASVLKQGKELVNDLKLEDILKFIKYLLSQDSRIQIIGLGVPAIISKEIVIESDIPNLKNVNLKAEIEKATGLKTVVKNDMNYTAYGCYLHNNKKDLCYVTFPLNSGPGCGSVINGKLIEGENSIAGEILYLPFFKYLKQEKLCFDYSPEDVALSLCCVASIINPSIVILTGEAIEADAILKIKKICLEYLPSEFMPELTYCANYENDYLLGIQEVIRESFIKQDK